MPTNISQLVHEMNEAFTLSERDNGDKFWHLKNGSPEWMTDVCLAAHGDMFPDDWRYACINQILGVLDYSINEDSDRDDMCDMLREIESDVYNHDLATLLASHLSRGGYVDDAIDEYGWPDDIFTALQYGQAREIEECGSLLINALFDVAVPSEEPGDDFESRAGVGE